MLTSDATNGIQNKKKCSEFETSKLSPQMQKHTTNKSELKSSFDEELRKLEEAKDKEPNFNTLLNSMTLYNFLLPQGISLFQEPFPIIENKDTKEKKFFEVEALLIAEPTKIDLEPIIDLDKEKLKISIEFPSLNDLKSVNVQYDPSSRSVIAEMITSSEAAKVLQAQVAQLERNLAKHNLKLQAIKIIPSQGNSSNEQRQNRKRRQ